MGYFTGTKNIYDILDDICSTLIASSGGHWTDGDATWTTTDRTVANNGKRCLKYTNGSEYWWLAMTVVNVTSGWNYALVSNHSYWYYGKGIQFVFSQSWEETHTFPANSYSSFIPFIIHSGAVGTNLATHQLTYYMWIDETGICMMSKGEPTGEGLQPATLVGWERIEAKEYTDGYTNVVFYSINQILNKYDGENRSVNDKTQHRSVIRPFCYTYPAMTDAGHYDFGFSGWSTPSTSGDQGRSSFKSHGNGKVYYMKPVVHNHAGWQKPIFQTEMSFAWHEGEGLIDGDVIALEGTSKKFLVKALDSADTTGRLNYAIRYV
ncbi:MAG: hypothetical protein KKD46_03435 [Euryarchaeota archaeon]|nr:hypothetical protein [Euryarchaeota archaeon]MBU4339953.1 hypothetical protein [Euryarchaeota archaeon]MCG2737753.1 hypothetical protein [Candidatus Methanoperedenaceae archaeon]